MSTTTPVGHRLGLGVELFDCQTVTTTGNQLEMILTANWARLSGRPSSGEHDGLAQLPSADVVVHASVDRGELRASVELPSGRVRSAVGCRERPITFVSKAAPTGRVLRVKLEAVGGEVSDIAYLVRVTSR